MDPHQTAPKGSSLIRVHIVCFHEKIKSEVHLNICSRRKKQTFLGQKNSGGNRVKAYLKHPIYNNSNGHPDKNGFF